jgi:hypothetical protein
VERPRTNDLDAGLAGPDDGRARKQGVGLGQVMGVFVSVAVALASAATGFVAPRRAPSLISVRGAAALRTA